MSAYFQGVAGAVAREGTNGTLPSDQLGDPDARSSGVTGGGGLGEAEAECEANLDFLLDAVTSGELTQAQYDELFYEQYNPGGPCSANAGGG